MAPKDTEHCENCLKHRSQFHYFDRRCDQCLDGQKTLRRCSSCKLVRYCSRECQRAHWKQHQPCCQVNVDLHRLRERINPIIAERQKTFEKWCVKNSEHITQAALSALEIMRGGGDREVIETRVFLVYIDVVEKVSSTSSMPKFVRGIRDARRTSMTEIHKLLRSRFAGGYDSVERYLAHRPGVMRILIIDDGLPVPFDTYTMPTFVDSRTALFSPFDPSWLPRLKRDVEKGLVFPTSLPL